MCEVKTMNMNEVIARINELARKVKAGETLTPEELEERTRLRNIYKESVVGNLRTHLESTTLVYPDGSKKKVTHK
jgi:uncharacterized protein YnzC (UPF0291/DUF896 family)